MKAPAIRNPFAAKPLPEQPDIEAAALRSDRFRLEREGDWRRLERIVRRLERGSVRRLSDEDILELPVLYRQAASSLAVARETSLDAATLRFLEDLPIERFFGIGKVTSSKMFALGIFTGKDLKEKSMDFLIEHFKSAGENYYKLVRGIHESPVRPNRIQKSVAAEHTFSQNLTSEVYMMEKLEAIAEELEGRLKRSKIAGKTITLKIKYSDFTQQTRSRTLQQYVKDKNVLLDTVRDLLYQERIKESVRLLGISVSNLDNNPKREQKVMDVQLKLEF